MVPGQKGIDMKHALVTSIVLAAVVAGLLLGQAPASSSGQEWELIAGRVAGYAGGQALFGGAEQGEMYLYNKRTGKVYKYFAECASGDAEAQGGCFYGLPVLDTRDGFWITPTPQTRQGARE